MELIIQNVMHITMWTGLKRHWIKACKYISLRETKIKKITFIQHFPGCQAHTSCTWLSTGIQKGGYHSRDSEDGPDWMMYLIFLSDRQHCSGFLGSWAKGYDSHWWNQLLPKLKWKDVGVDWLSSFDLGRGHMVKGTEQGAHGKGHQHSHLHIMKPLLGVSFI